MRAALPSILLALLIVPLAGCIGDGEPQDPPMATDLDGDGGNETMDANNTTDVFGPRSVVESPTWVVGQWWGHHIFDREGNPSGQHHNVAVVDDADGYLVATRHEGMARREAQDDLPTLGTHAAGMATTNQGEAFFWYDWPLEVNKTWTQPFSVGNTTHDLTFTVGFSDEVPSALGKKPGFTVAGTNGDGATVMAYDYVPDLGWFAELFVYDPDAAEPETPEYRIMNMGFGTDYADEWRTYTISDLVDWEYGYDVAGGSVPDAALEETFEVADGTAKLYGPATVTVSTGQVTLRLTDPDGETYELEASAPEGTESKTFDIAEPVAGAWTARIVGAGSVVAVSLSLDALDETVGTVTPASG